MNAFTIGEGWTLFLDRDGVINHEMHLSYVNTLEEFKFYEGAKEAFKIFAARFKHIIIVTNQRGVGRGITIIENLNLIHKAMVAAVTDYGGRIDGVYFAAELDIDSPNRKPNTGMALQAQKKFPAIDFLKSVMVGNNISDMEFGNNIGAKTVLLLTTMATVPPVLTYLDASYNSLAEFAASL